MADRWQARRSPHRSRSAAHRSRERRRRPRCRHRPARRTGPARRSLDRPEGNVPAGIQSRRRRWPRSSPSRSCPRSWARRDRLHRRSRSRDCTARRCRPRGCGSDHPGHRTRCQRRVLRSAPRIDRSCTSGQPCSHHRSCRRPARAAQDTRTDRSAGCTCRRDNRRRSRSPPAYHGRPADLDQAAGSPRPSRIPASTPHSKSTSASRPRLPANGTP